MIPLVETGIGQQFALEDSEQNTSHQGVLMRIRDWFVTKVYISLSDNENGFSYRSDHGWFSSRRWFVPFARAADPRVSGPAVSTIPLPDSREPRFHS